MWPGLTVAVLLALLAFIISFDALRVVGLACGINARLAWMFPLIIDGSTLAFTWAAWAFKTRRLSTVYPWLMLVLFSIISLIGNALHAHPVQVNGLLLPDWVPPLIMTVPPVALLATTHMIVLAAGRSFDNDDLEWETGQAKTDEPETDATVDDPVAAFESDPMPAPPIVRTPEPIPEHPTDDRPEPKPEETRPAELKPIPATPLPATDGDGQPDGVETAATPVEPAAMSSPEPAGEDESETPTEPNGSDARPSPRPPVNPVFLEPTPPGGSLSERWARENNRTLATPVARILGLDDNQ